MLKTLKKRYAQFGLFALPFEDHSKLLCIFFTKKIDHDSNSISCRTLFLSAQQLQTCRSLFCFYELLSQNFKMGRRKNVKEDYASISCNQLSTPQNKLSPFV